jgi:predicted metal-dependent hydrolase
MVPKEARERLDAGYRRGIELFNAEQFFECHEVLEEVWRAAPAEERFFLQALIHFAVGFYHHQRGNPDGADRQLRKALRKLAGYLPNYGGLDTAQIYREGVAAREPVIAGRRIERFPKWRHC